MAFTNLFVFAVDTADHYLIKWSSVLKPQVTHFARICHVLTSLATRTTVEPRYNDVPRDW